MKKLGVALVLVVAVYVAGFWPEWRRRSAAEELVQEERAQLAESEARVRGAQLLGQVLNLQDVAASHNYGQAQELASRFFDAVRVEAGRSPGPAAAAAYASVVKMRDGVTAALTRSDPSVTDLLRRAEVELRRSLGYAVSAVTPPPSTAASPAPAG